MRAVGFGGGLVLLAVLCWASSAGPTLPAPARRAPRPRATAEEKAKPSLPARLARKVHFKGFEDPKTTLGDALDRLARDHGVAFDVDERAFKAGCSILLDPAVRKKADLPLTLSFRNVPRWTRPCRWSPR